MLDAKNKEEYIKQLQQGFFEEFGINIYKGDISNIKEEEIKNKN